MPADLRPPLWITFVVLLTLAVTFAASWWMFFALAHRWTDARPWQALSDWSKERGFRFIRGPASPTDLSAQPPLPPPLNLLHDRQPWATFSLVNPRQQLIAFRWHAPPLPPEAHTDAGPRPDPDGWSPGHILLQTIDDAWPPTGLRPAEHAISLLDALAPGGGGSIHGSTERFAAIGDDPVAQRKLTASSVRALLPADVGFLLIGNTMLLDFSARPFDPIELDRMLSVANQVAAHVPRLAG
jgi:hypothetical protein